MILMLVPQSTLCISTPGKAMVWSQQGQQFVYWRAKEVGTVRPRVTGLSGQLQRAFVTGVNLVETVRAVKISAI